MPPRMAVLRPQSPSGDARRFDALGSDVRNRVLEFLSKGEATVLQIAAGVHANPATLRYHLGLLLREGLVEEIRPHSQGSRGRPAILYRTTRRAVVPGFPERHFDMLALAAIQTLVEASGGREAARRLSKKGAEVGRTMVESVAAQDAVGRWSPESFERLVLQGLFPAFGVSCKVLSRGPDSLTYRSFTCPFLELAEKIPEYVCDAMDTGFHEGIDRSVGAVTTRVACMGHGDSHCEYAMSWPASSRSRRTRSRTEASSDD